MFKAPSFFQPPPVPFEYSFSAGRAGGGNKPDRYVIQKGDEHGVVQVCVTNTYIDIATPIIHGTSCGIPVTNTFKLDD